MSNVRSLRSLIFALAIILLLLIGGGVYLWSVGGKALDTSATILATPDKLKTEASESTYLPTPSYKLADLSTTPADDHETLTAYSRAVAEIMSVYGDNAIENELRLAVEAAKTGDSVTIAKIAAASTRHSEASLRLKALTVPAGVAQVHLNLINSLIGLAEASYLMSTIKETPVVALASAQYTYPARLKDFSVALSNLSFFLSASGV